MTIKCFASASATCVSASLPYTKDNSQYPCNIFATCSESPSLSSSTNTTTTVTRTSLSLSLSLLSTTFSAAFIFSLPPPSYSSHSPSSKFSISDFFELPNSGGLKALDLLVGSGEVPTDGDQASSKTRMRFDSTYDIKDENGDPNPYVFVLGAGKVIAGIDVAVRSMKVGGIRRVIIPPSLGYKNTSREPIPPNVCNSSAPPLYDNML